MITFLVLVSVFAPTARSQARYRNLKDYTQGPSLDLKDQYLDAKKTELQIAPARQFLWELWKSRTRGYFKETSYSVEGVPGWCTFFVEPDRAGKWQIVLECRTSTCPFLSKARCRKYLRTIATETYDSVERIKTGYSIYSHSPPKILDNEDRSPLEYVLIIRSSVTGHTGQL
jgi:hypothetical protein